jgi:prepilin-type processing-associated H-X9-DG protein
VLLGLVLPALSGARRGAITAKCLSNMRSLEQAHWSYAMEHRGLFIDAGLSHGGLANEEIAWVNTLEKHYGNKLVLRSPADRSPHWPSDVQGGVPVPGTNDHYRRTSYGINNYVTATKSPAYAINPQDAADRLAKVTDPSNTVHFLMMVFTNEPNQQFFAASDHVHVEQWWPVQQTGLGAAAAIAATQCQTNAHGGPPASIGSRSNWGFLDGHVETAIFAEVYIDRDNLNRFDPAVSKFWATRRAHTQQ